MRRIPAALSTIVVVASILLSGQATVIGSGNAKPHPTQKPRPTATPQPSASPTASPTATPSPGTCTLFPSSNVWNKPIASLAVRSDSAALINAIGLTTGLHPDFSNVGGYGIPYNLVGAATPRYPVSFYYPDESDAGPYPIPNNPLIEGGSDRHLLAWDTNACYLYEIFDASVSGGSWSGGSGAIWDLRSNALRPDGWTSADAAGLPILPGLVRYDEVALASSRTRSGSRRRTRPSRTSTRRATRRAARRTRAACRPWDCACA